ncbi:hypothetical protein TNCT_197521 [Trichonephila clavata]|uniref:Uncharacterized protein n=1 Tax=Trichonephila clavata TaxID=2740835 RepID=A0A8X6HYV2_TRICU|nr:hypothetical protein TNCT_197521 [Trichonephila clavata]
MLSEHNKSNEKPNKAEKQSGKKSVDCGVPLRYSEAEGTFNLQELKYMPMIDYSTDQMLSEHNKSNEKPNKAEKQSGKKSVDCCVPLRYSEAEGTFNLQELKYMPMIDYSTGKREHNIGN